TYNADYRLLHRDGSTRWVSETGRGVFNEHDELTWIDGVIMDQTAARARNAEFEGTVRAIDLSLATIEYDLLGHVLRANRNFLDLFGYRLDEVAGRHHGMFCEPGYAHTPEHVQFWRRLAEGELVHVRSPRGELVLPLHLDENVPPAGADIPMHWGDEFIGAQLGINAVTQPAFCPDSKQPELKFSAVAIEP
ncbi:MAG: PAS domain-containing protein, partial [Gemmatimonadetes bacterium]|nr:PAS domain-containing protein [Gemmatimonadota bacterium]